MVKDLTKQFKGRHSQLLLGVAIIFIGYLMYRYVNRSNSDRDYMSSGRLTKSAYSTTTSDKGSVRPANPQGENEQYMKVDDIEGQVYPSSDNSGQSTISASDLLPKDSNSQFQRLSPNGVGNLQDVNLLKAGYNNGIDTIGSSLRNANLQLRSEPPNPTSKVSPWMNSTIEPDLMRVPLEIGGCN